VQTNDEVSRLVVDMHTAWWQRRVDVAGSQCQGLVAPPVEHDGITH